MAPGKNAKVGGDSRWHIRHILIGIKADVVDSVALAALFESLRCSWGVNYAMPMQDVYKALVTTNFGINCNITLTYYSGLSSYHLSISVEFLRGYKSLVVVLLAHKQIKP